MTVERWAQQVIENELIRRVVVHDDGSQPSMYDLRIGPAVAPDVVIECVRAVDPDRTETWNVGPGKGPLHLSVEGDWVITIARDARIDKIKQHIETFLHGLEERDDIRRVSVRHLLRRRDYRLLRELESLGIRHAYCLRMPGTGRVHWTMEGTSGFVDTAGSALPGWIEEFLRDPERGRRFASPAFAWTHASWDNASCGVAGSAWGRR